MRWLISLPSNGTKTKRNQKLAYVINVKKYQKRSIRQQSVVMLHNTLAPFALGGIIW